jgi:hypothetical protein
VRNGSEQRIAPPANFVIKSIMGTKESIVKSITCNLPDSLYEALQDRIQTDGQVAIILCLCSLRRNPCDT